MKETPIMFTPDHVRAILDGKKTQTRRVIRPSHDMRERSPYGGRGDLLWVREAWALVPVTAYRASEGVQQTLSPIDPHDAAVYKAGWTLSPPTKWRHAMYMPRWASRITLRITEVRVERLQDMPWQDVIKEGIPQHTVARGVLADNPPDPRWAYIKVWDDINGKRAPWASNPWVWAISFEVQR